MVIKFGPQIGIRGATNPDFSRIGSFIGGPSERWTVTEYSGFQFGIQVDLGPFAINRLVGHMDAGPVDLEDVLGPQGHRLTDRLAEVTIWPACFDLLDDFLRRRLGEHSRPSDAISWAVDRLKSSVGRVGVGALSREIGWSRRHFISRFKSVVGTTPGTYGRLVRFRRALRTIERGDSLTQTALTAGYFDHSHLDRDFREFAGYSPTAYSARRLPDGFGVGA